MIFRLKVDEKLADIRKSCVRKKLNRKSADSQRQKKSKAE
jgi:hypothetical protein